MTTPDTRFKKLFYAELESMGYSRPFKLTPADDLSEASLRVARRLLLEDEHKGKGAARADS